MTTPEYTKIIIGEALDDSNSPLIAHGTPIQTDSDPIPAVEVSNNGYQYQDSSRRLGYHSNDDFTIDYKEPLEDCAKIGCLLSWVPIVGFLTCCLNADAPSKSRREYWAHRACAISCLVSIIIFIIWISIESISDDDNECVGKEC